MLDILFSPNYDSKCLYIKICVAFVAFDLISYDCTHQCDWMFLLLLALFQDQVDAAVKQLLALKAEYKQQTGQDYKPGSQAPASPAPVQTQASSASAQCSSSPQALFSQVAQQGELVRKLKSEKAPKV